MRVAHVVATIDDPTAGPSQSVGALFAAQRELGCLTSLHTVAGWRGTTPVAKIPDHQRHRQSLGGVPGLSSLCLSRSLSATLKSEAARSDVIHSHGLWLGPNMYPYWAVRGTHCTTMISPRGMLGAAALAFSVRKKKVVWELLQRRAVADAHCLHATSEQELEEVRSFGIDRPVCVISNGIDIPRAAPSVAAKPFTVLSLGRIHPKKGLVTLVKAWSHTERAFPDWKLRIVGSDELGHSAELTSLAASLGLKRITIEAAVTGDAKLMAYHEAALFVLSSLNENFGMTVAEALAAGTPVISTKGAPWSRVEEEGCGWWVDLGVEPLAAALKRAMSYPLDELAVMGANGRAWMARDFGWDSVAVQMIAVYEWMAGRGDRPPHVKLA